MWGAAQATIIGGVGGVIATTHGDLQSTIGVAAFSTWPLGLAMHGGWAQSSAPYSGFPTSVVPIVAIDAATLAFDVALLAKKRSPTGLYGIAEWVGAIPQVVFGLAAASGGRRQDLPLTLGLTALPVAMVAHGAYVLFLAPPPPLEDEALEPPPPPPPPLPAPVTGALRWTVVPHVTSTSAGAAIAALF
jgi:hypothetical protein